MTGGVGRSLEWARTPDPAAPHAQNFSRIQMNSNRATPIDCLGYADRRVRGDMPAKNPFGTDTGPRRFLLHSLTKPRT